MRVAFLGVRGSTPAPGADFVRYGGHTSCISLAHDADSAPALVLDAGTGLRTLTGLLAPEPFRGSILLSHLHWDHVMGIPFFGAGDRADARVDVVLPAGGVRTGADLIAQLMSPPAFPITPAGLLGSWTFRAIEPRPMRAEGFDVVPFDVVHKGGRTFGYRVSSGASCLGYVPDHAPAAGVSDAALEALRGVDVLVHDAQFLAHERRLAHDYGHATIDEAIGLAQRVEAGMLVLFHHGPGRTDAALDEIAREHHRDGWVRTAHEGMVLDLP